MTDDNRLGKVVAVVAAVASALFIGYQAGHSTGLRVVAVILEALLLIVVRASVTAHRATPKHREIPDPNADFARYRMFVSAFRFASNRQFDFDRSTKPPLLRLYSRVLAEQHDVRIVADRHHAREVMGPAAWLLDDETGARPDPEGPGIARKSLEEAVSRLEELAR